MKQIEYQYRGSKERLDVTPEQDWYSVVRFIYSPRKGDWLKWETFSVKTKTGLFLYVLNKDPDINLDHLINLEG